jgi:hypothetical protein
MARVLERIGVLLSLAGAKGGEAKGVICTVMEKSVTPDLVRANPAVTVCYNKCFHILYCVYRNEEEGRKQVSFPR